MTLRIVTVLAAALAALLVSGIPAAAAEPTWIGIGGPQDWTPRPGYTLEVGDDAWRVDAINGGGVTTIALTSATVVRVRGLSDCVPVVRFVALPGRDYFIRFAGNGSARVEDWTGEGMDSGPALGDPIAPMCPPLPDTSTSDAAPPASNSVWWFAAVAGVIAAVFDLRRPMRR